MRQSALKRRAPMKRGARVRPSSQPNRSVRPPRPRHERKLAERLQERWAICGRSGPCRMCRSTSRLKGHHVVEREHLRTQCEFLGYSNVRTLYVLYDLRNCLSVCEGCHTAHHWWSRDRDDGTPRRIPRNVVLKHCPDVLAFAAEHGLEHRFDRAYPAKGAKV